MMLDRGVRSYGSGRYWHQSVDDDEDAEMRDDDKYEDQKMRDVDVDELGIDVNRIIAQQTTSCSNDAAAASSSIATNDDEDDSSMTSSQFVLFGNDNHEQNMDIDIGEGGGRA